MCTNLRGNTLAFLGSWSFWITVIYSTGIEKTLKKCVSWNHRIILVGRDLRRLAVQPLPSGRKRGRQRDRIRLLRALFSWGLQSSSDRECITLFGQLVSTSGCHCGKNLILSWFTLCPLALILQANRARRSLACLVDHLVEIGWLLLDPSKPIPSVDWIVSLEHKTDSSLSQNCPELSSKKIGEPVGISFWNPLVVSSSYSFSY